MSRCYVRLPLSEWTTDELEHSIQKCRDTLEFRRDTKAIQDYLAKLLVERTERFYKTNRNH